MSHPSKAVAVDVSIPRWILVFGVLAALLLAVGAGLSLLSPQRLVTPGVEINSAVQIYAGYTFSRNLGVFVVLCVGLIKQSRSILKIMFGLFFIINLCDALMDIRESRFPIFVIAFLLSLISAIAFVKLPKTDQHSAVQRHPYPTGM